ncbi:hypothetical protein Dvar_10820 [Desulfosarcina variabilis str. Montpellier]|uniref:DUF7948 domain-containing protein n=1 Tax=Desulfosarcina variabilis TaxID=2300 RepID=UPI003AFA04A7
MSKIKSAILSLIALLLFTTIASGAVSKKTDPEVMTKANRITIPFVENKGQLEDSNVLFYSNTFVGRVSVNKDASIGYDLGPASAAKTKKHQQIREMLRGALKPLPSGGQKAIAKVSHFRGKYPEKWVKDLSTFNTVDMGEIYKGIRLNLQAHGNNVEKIFHVQPGADPKSIQLTIQGADSLKLTPQGELEVNADTRSIRFTRPVAYQQIDGEKTAVDVAYTVNGKSYGFKVAAYDQTKELIIDPLINAYFIGETLEATRPTCMATDSEGNVYVAGFYANSYTVFKLDSRVESVLGQVSFGSLYWFKDGDPNVYDIAVDSQNNIYLVGITDDRDFPVTDNSFDTVFHQNWGDDEGFVIKFNCDLNQILASSFIGASSNDGAYGVAISQDDTVYVIGETSNPVSSSTPDLPPFPTTTDAYDTTPGPFLKTKAFVIRLDSELQTMLAGTLLGYDGDLDEDDYLLDDCAYGVAIDVSGNVVVTGVTESEHFPVSGNCADEEFEGESEVFISKFDPNLQRLLASTFLGGFNDEKANALAIDADNEIFVVGWTMSSNFPVVQGNYDAEYNQSEDGFVCRLNSDLTEITASTFIGGESHDQVSDVVIHEDGRVFLAGGTASVNFPTTPGSYDEIFNGGKLSNFNNGDGFFMDLDNSLTACNSSTFLGGEDNDYISSILVNGDDILVAGATFSSNFPYVIENKGAPDAFICRFNENEDPSPLPIAGPGHWKSNGTGSSSTIYLDINICADGPFSGVWRIYYCSTIDCRIDDSFPPEPISGNIDFENSSGTMDFNEECQDIPFRITKQTPERMIIDINPGDQIAGNCLGSVRSYIDSKGECEAGTCENDDVDDDNDDDDGGGGGCFISALF